jgi:puromycin-sensitive aminopeptidase
VLFGGLRAVLAQAGAAEWAVVNDGGHGFYRVRYAPELRERLLANLAELSAVERFNLVNDSWAAALAGLTPLAEHLDLTARFRGERDRNVWAALLGPFHTLNRIVEDADRPRLAALVLDRVGPAAAELGWSPRDGESELTRQLRGDLLRALGTLGDDAATQARAAEAFAAAGTADANVLAAAVPILAHVGDAARYDDFGRRYQSATTPQEEQRYLLALAGFRPPGLVDRTLARTLDGDVRTQDAPFVLRSLLLSVDGRAKAWAFVKANWERIAAKFPINGLRRVCEAVVGLATPEGEKDVREFFEAKKVNLGGKTLEQYLEQLHVAVRLREREAAALAGLPEGKG